MRKFKEVFLVDEQTVKQRTIVNTNVEAHYIKSAIYETQVVDLQQLIGTNLLDKLCTLKGNNEIDLPENSNYKELLEDYIEDYLCFGVVKNIQLLLFAKIRNAGVTNYADATENNLSLKEVQYIIQNAEDKVNFFGNRITQYLSTNASKFKEYYNRKTEDLPHNPYQAVSNSIYLG